MKKHEVKTINSNTHVNLTDIKDFLPIGSIVRLAINKQKYMIYGIAQSESAKHDKYFDYIAVEYPEGSFVACNTILFNHNDISDILHRGYVDDEYQNYIDMIAACQNM